MSLIAGCFCFKGRPDSKACLQKLKGFPILLKETGGTYEYLMEEGLQACVMAKYKQTTLPQVYWGRTEHLFLLTLGFHDLSYPIEWAVPLSFEQTAEKIQAGEGEFVSILMDRQDGRLAIINNRYGTRPLYYLQAEERFWFSSNVTFLMNLSGQRAQPDPLGVMQIVCYGHTLTPQTHTRGVERLFPGSCMTATSEGIQQKRYWRLGYYNVGEDLDPTTYAKEVFEAMERGLVKKTRRSPVGFMSLSGGLDSRLVAGAAYRQCNYFAFTFSNDTQKLETPDVVAARKICQRLGLEHRVVQMTVGEASASADEIIHLTGGMTPLHHPLKNWQSIKMMLDTTRFKIGGGCGDPVGGDYVNSIYQIEPEWTDGLLRLYAMRRTLFLKKDLFRVFRREVVEETFGPMEQTLISCLRGLSGPTAAHKIAAWSQVYFNSGFTFSGAIHNHPDVSEASPQLGYEYVEKMLRLPANWLYKKNFYQYMIYHCLPQLRDVEYANTGRTLSGQMETYHLPLKKKMIRSVYKRLPFPVVAKLWEKPPILRASAIGVYAGDNRLFEEMRQIFAGTSFWREILHSEGCLTFMNDYEAGRCTFSCLPIDDELFGSLVSLFYWFKQTGG
jgi:hypothetical protein